MAIPISTSSFSPKHAFIRRDLTNYNGTFNPVHAIVVASGTLSNLAGLNTGSVKHFLGCPAIHLKRVEVYHSGAASQFNFEIVNRLVSGSVDGLDTVVLYSNIPGGDNFTTGLDQVEDLIGFTNNSSSVDEGAVHLKFMPGSPGVGETDNNHFRYRVIFEAVMLYVDRYLR